jgi:hypothetical protein
MQASGKDFQAGKMASATFRCSCLVSNGPVISRQCCDLPDAAKSEEEGGVEILTAPFEGRGRITHLKKGGGEKNVDMCTVQH